MVGMMSAFAAVRMQLQFCFKAGGGGSVGSISRIRFSISSLETGDAGARLLSAAFSPMCTSFGTISTTTSSIHCASRKGTSTRTNGRNGAGFFAAPRTIINA